MHKRLNVNLWNSEELECCSTRAAGRARNPCLSPIAISPAGTGRDKASYSHYDVIGDWGHDQRYGHTDTLPRFNIQGFARFWPVNHFAMVLWQFIFCTQTVCSWYFIPLWRHIIHLLTHLQLKDSYTILTIGISIQSIHLHITTQMPMWSILMAKCCTKMRT